MVPPGGRGLPGEAPSRPFRPPASRAETVPSPSAAVRRRRSRTAASSSFVRSYPCAFRVPCGSLLSPARKARSEAALTARSRKTASRIGGTRRWLAGAGEYEMRAAAGDGLELYRFVAGLPQPSLVVRGGVGAAPGRQDQHVRREERGALVQPAHVLSDHEEPPRRQGLAHAGQEGAVVLRPVHVGGVAEVDSLERPLRQPLFHVPRRGLYPGRR